MKQQRTKPRDETPDTLAYYAQPGPMTGAGRHTEALAALPADVAKLAKIIQGLAVHQYMADAYGFEVPEARTAESAAASAPSSTHASSRSTWSANTGTTPRRAGSLRMRNWTKSGAATSASRSTR
jgi:hypothetical protein